MTAVLVAADSRYVARITCLGDKRMLVDCESIAHVAQQDGKQFIPGIIDCKAERNGNMLSLDVIFNSTIDPEELRGRLYAIVISVEQQLPDLGRLIAASINIEEMI